MAANSLLKNDSTNRFSPAGALLSLFRGSRCQIHFKRGIPDGPTRRRHA